ncbi:MAG: ASCH domain-containing protein [Bacilli bacterium]|nr:ASCH domain-containing protein [Bacilli bacterium]
MRDEILNNLKTQLDKNDYEVIKDKNIHLGVFSEPCLSYMLEGKKTIESRISKKRIAPYHNINKDDIVVVKKSGGGVVAYFTIKDIKFIDLNKVSIKEIEATYSKELCVSDEFWEQKKDSSYATLMFIDKLVKVNSFKINKKGMQTWVVLDK